MGCKLFLVLCAIISIINSLEAASLRNVSKNTAAVVQKLDYEGVEANVRNARQTYAESGEDSNEDDDQEDDAELQHQSAIRQQQAYEQSVDDSQEGSDEDNFEEDVEDYLGRRLRRDVLETVEGNNKIEENSKPSNGPENKDKQPALQTTSTTSQTPSSTDFSNTSVLILIRDVIKKVTELSNTQQVATSAQQYFQLFEHLLQQTIKQVIGEDDDDDEEEEEVESTTIAIEAEKESENVTQASENSDNPQEISTGNKGGSVDLKVPQPAKMPQEVNEIKS